MNINYTAIIIDIQHSRKYTEEQRSIIQEKLVLITKFINNFYDKELVKKFEFSGGDSIQALFIDVSSAFSCYCFIRNLFYPYHIRCGIGYGNINQIILDKDYNNSNMLDGDAYHYAISKLNDCKKGEFNILMYSGNDEKDALVNKIMGTVELLNKLHTNNQSEIFDIFNLLYPLDMKYDEYNKNIEFIINIIKQNVTLYNLDSFSLTEIIKIFPIEEKNNNLLNNEINCNRCPQVFPTKINSFLANLLNVSRHNIEKIRNKGNFDEIRKLEHLVLEYIKREYDRRG